MWMLGRRLFCWLLFLLAAGGCNNESKPIKKPGDDKYEVLTAFFNHGRLSFSATMEELSEKGALPSDRHLKILIDSVTPIIDSSLVRKILGPLVHIELANKLIRLNMTPSKIGAWILNDTSEFSVTDSAGIFKFNHKLVVGGIDLKKDTLYSNFLRIYHPAINMEKTKAVIAYAQNGTLFFSIFERDSVWNLKSTIPSEIE